MSDVPAASDDGSLPLPSSGEGRQPMPLRALRELLDHDEAALRDALAQFLTSLADVRAGMRAAIQIHDLEALAFHAHRFKSAAGQIDAAECYRLCGLFKELPGREAPAVFLEAEGLAGQLLAALDALEPEIRYTMATLRG